VKRYPIAVEAIIQETRAAELGLCPSCLQECGDDYWSLILPGETSRWVFCTRCFDPAKFQGLTAGLTILGSEVR
jgi:hypothetical protein